MPTLNCLCSTISCPSVINPITYTMDTTAITITYSIITSSTICTLSDINIAISQPLGLVGITWTTPILT